MNVFQCHFITQYDKRLENKKLFLNVLTIKALFANVIINHPKKWGKVNIKMVFCVPSRDLINPDITELKVAPSGSMATAKANSFFVIS